MIRAGGPDGAPEARFLPRHRLDDLIGLLGVGGRRVVGPMVRDGAIVVGDLPNAAALPVGWTLVTEPGLARLERLPDGPGAARTFHYPVTADGIKRFTFPSRVEALSMSTTTDGSVAVTVEAPPAPVPLAIIGARACDLAAVHVTAEALDIVDGYVRPASPSVPATPRPGVAAWATEAPRGLLFHRYVVGDDGKVAAATIVPPTSQNQAAIEADLAAFAPAVLDLPMGEATHRLEGLIRSYDPCISCATHFLDLSVEKAS